MVSRRESRDIRLRELWQGVDPYAVGAVLAHLEDRDEPGVSALVDNALSRSGIEAASELMRPVAAAAALVDPAQQFEVFHALDALIRAGGDPSAALPTLVRGLGESRTEKQACEALRRAALSGCSLAPVREALEKVAAGSHGGSVSAVQRLETLQRRGMQAELRRLSIVYAQQRPYGNLHGGIGLVEESLLASDDSDLASARHALAELERAGSDFYLCWIALVPVLRGHLRRPDSGRREQAAKALGQLSFAITNSTKLEKAEAVRRILALLYPVLAELAALLGGDDAERTAAATTIEVFAEIGCPLSDIRDRLEAALGDDRVDVRSACSRALSTALQRTGAEARLPLGRSHRRTYAASDTPLSDQRPTRCPQCDAQMASVIYESRSRGNTWDDTTIELKCSSCGIYSVESFGY